MIGGGGKIGGAPPRPTAALPEGAAETAGKAAANEGNKLAPASDRFEKAANKPGTASPQSPAAMGREASASTDVFKLARENPAQARQLIATMAAQTSRTLAEIEAQVVGARRLMEKLAAEGFKKDAVKQRAEELAKRRGKLRQLKTQLRVSERKMALLQQLAGQLGDPRLEEELDRLLSHHDKLQTDWGKRHHLLAMVENFYGSDGQTPEHLRDVVRADVRVLHNGQHPGGEAANNALEEVSPRRVIAEIIARTLDGTTRQTATTAAAQQTNVHGRTLQSWAAVGKLMADSLAADPLATGTARKAKD